MTVPPHAIELVLDGDSDRQVRIAWAALVEAGLPSRARHRGSTNAPHLTVLSAPRFTSEQLAAAALGLEALLPVTMRVAGFGLLGCRTSALCWLVQPPPALTALVAELRADDSANRHGWLPHVTLADRVPVNAVSTSLDVITRAAPRPAELRFCAARHWDPESRSVRLLAGAEG